ncbi:MAG TPA: RHS repeat-associated core domain-containing protein [Candidatus Angelobacter sp.]
MHVTVGMLTGTRNSKGTEFWLMFDETDNESLATATLFITSETDATGTVSVPGLNFTQSFTVAATQITNVVLPNGVFHVGTDKIENLGIHVVSDHEITVYGLNFQVQAADAYLGLPVSALGTEYINASYTNVTPSILAIFTDPGTQFGVVAPYDDTTVTVTPSITTGGRKQGVPYSFVLHRGRTYQLQDKTFQNDLTGTIISSDKPIAVFGSHKCADILSAACNHLVEQLPSTDTWGSRFVTVPLATRKNGDTFRFIGATDGTTISIDGQAITTINRGEFYETLLTQPSYIVSSNPVLVVQYSNGSTFDGATGDPFMIVVPPVEQFRAAYTVTTVQPGYFLENFLNIVIPTSAKGSLQLDGVAVAPASFTDVAGSGYSTAQLTVSQGAHRVVSTAPFGVFSYGFAPFDGYGYTGGIALPGVPGGSISLFPSTATQTTPQATNTQACFVASVADAAQNTLSAINVTFSVTGANPQTGSVDTDNNGQAQFCYTGVNAGTDTVTVSIVTTTATSSINWQANAANQAPQVSLPASLSVSLPNTAKLIGIVTDDGLPAGGGLTFTWSQVSGPGTTTFSNVATAVTTASFSAPGDYVLQLTASDSLLTGSATTTVHVSDSRNNKAPVITPLPAQTLDFGSDPQGTLTLAPTVTDDGLPVGSKLSYNWSVVSFPTTGITILDPTGASTDVVIADNGTDQTFTLQLTVDDSQLSSKQSFTINTITGNKAPNVFAGTGGTITLPANTFTFNGSVNDDGKPVGGHLTVQWSMINGPAPVTFSSLNTPVTTVTLPQIPGTYTFRLTANDGQLTSTSDTGVVVNPANQPPSVVITSVDPVSETITLPTNSVTIGATITDDGLPSGILNIAWSQLTGPAPVVFSAPNQATTKVTFSTAGFYVLQVMGDDTQLHSTSQIGITVRPQNQAPVVNAGPNQSIALPTNTVTLNGTVRDDGLPAGAPVTQQWSEVSGPAPVSFSSPTSTTTQATFSTAGTYDLRLTASDTQLTGSSDVIITVLSAPQNLPPVVSAGLNQTVTLPGPNSSVQVFLGGSVTDDGLPPGAPVTQQWSEVSGPASVTFSNPTSPGTFATFTAAGLYRLRLTATDTQLTSSADVFVTVNPPINQPPVISALTFPAPIILPNGPSTVTFSANVTDDGLPNGTLTVQWVQLSGPLPVVFSAANATTTQATFPAAGTYIFQLSAFDGQLTTIQTFGIPVRSNQPPFVSVTATPQTVYLPNTTTLTANATDDGLPNGQLLYSWSQTFGPAPAMLSSPNSAVTQASFTVPGAYVFEVAVSDTQLTTTADFEVIVNPAVPPLTVAILSPVDGDTITHPVDVTGLVSNAGAWKLEYALTSGNDGDSPTFVQFASGTGPKVGASLGTGAALGTFDPTVLLNGIYTIRLTATDVTGNTGTISTVVSVAKNAKVGNLTLAFNDLTVPVPGVPIQIMRMYDSRDKSQGDFGIGWNLGLRNVRVQKNRVLGKTWTEGVTLTFGFSNYCLEPNGDRTVTITFPDQRVYEFQAVSGPECQVIAPIIAPAMQFAQIPTVPGTAGATLQPADGAALFIDGSVPGPQNIVDGSGNIYNPTLFQLTTAEGFTYIIDQNFGVTSVTDANGNKVTIGPNGITSSTGLSVPFVRDAQGRITQITDLNGNVLKYAYSDNVNLTGFTDGAGKTTGYGYTTNSQLTGIFTPNNGDIGFSYDPHGSGRLALIEAGGTTNISSNLAANQETITDNNGNPTTYTYDADGNIIQTVDALGNVRSATWDANDNELTKTDALGKTTMLTYDSANNKLTETDPLGNVTKYTYNGLRQVLTVTDPKGNVTSNNYDSKGNLLSTRDALGNTTSYTYDAHGQPLSVKDALGNTTSFVYDGNGRMTQQTDALNNVSSFTYDANGNKLTQAVTRTRADGTKETLNTQYQYDGNNRLVKTIYPDSSTTQTVYNSIGKPSNVFDALNHKTHYDYDTFGRLTTTTYADGTSESVTYDANGNRQTSTDRATRTTTYTYDALNRLTKTAYADSSNTQTVYDAAGRVIKTIDALGNVTQIGYDDAGRRTSTTDSLNHITSFTYDAAGNQLSMTDALSHTTQFVYDASNRRVQTVYPDHTTDSVNYDSLGRMSSKTDQAGKVTQFGYDPLGRLTSVTDALGQITKYGYDELGNRIGQTDANNHATSFAYDQLGRRTSRTLPLSDAMSESYGYDAAGNMTSKKDFNGHTTTYAYDTVNRLLSRTADSFFSTGACAGGACGATQASYTYTSTGRRATMSDASGITAYTYDQRDRLLTKANPLGTLTYAYDAAGNMLSLKSSNTGGASMTYGYDPLNRLASVQDASGTTAYSYDVVGNLGGYAYPNGVQTSYTYNSLNRLTNMQSMCGSAAAPSCGAPGTPIASYAYTLGAAGNRLSVTELSGRTVQYGYDDLYRLTSETISGAASQNGTISYVYDAVGNRKQLNSTVAAIPSGLLNYDANDRLTTDGYDANGNTINNGGIGNVYDFENHMVRHDSVVIGYDGDGNRVQETVAGVTTSYLVADQNLTGYAQVMDELQSGAVSRTYSYGLFLISQKLVASSQQLSFYGFDGHGSVRFLTSSTGAVTDTYDYDAFGNLISSTGSTPNNYLFAGEQFDPPVGIYYNRARYYDERSGRFWSMDTWEGDPQAPMSLHKYLYAGSNPIDRIDPSGNQTLTDVSITLGVIGTLVGLTISTGIFAYAAYNAVTRLPKDAFTKLPDAKLVGFQTSRSLGDFIPKSSPFLAGLAIGLGFTAGVGGVDVLFPRSQNLAWFYAYVGVSAGFKVGNGGPLPGEFAPPIDLNPAGLALPEFYVGAVWNVEHAEDYAGPFFCASAQVAAVKFPGVPRGPNVQVCSSTKSDGTPGAYSIVIGGSGILSSLSASITKYYFYGETPIK